MKDGEIVIKHFQSFQSLLEQLSTARAPIIDGCDHNQTSQKTLGWSKKTAILLQIFMWCHFNVMLIIGSSAKWIIWMSRNSNEKLIYIIFGFQFNKRTFELEKQLHPKHYILQRTMPRTFLILKKLW